MRNNSVRRVAAAVLGATGVVLSSATAVAQPAPNCTAADLALAMTGVSAGTSAYLFTHPVANEFYTSIKDMPPEEKQSAVTAFADQNPQIAAEMRGIRQPLVDFRNRCRHD